MELYIFSQDEQPLTVLSEDTGLIDTHYRIEINGIPDEPFIFSVEADNPTAAYVKEENKVIFRDHEGDWRLMAIREVDDSNDLYGPITLATCEPVSIAELNDNIIEERRFSEQPAEVALGAALNGTRWQADVESELGNASSSFYYLTSTEAVWKILDVWGGEFKDVVEFDEETNEIKGCYIKLIQRHGSEHGQRFEIDNNTTEIGRTVLSYPKTALYGRGASLEVEDEDGEHTGGYTRYIDFADVEWSVKNGDPVDKPKGQKWVGDPEALKAYGYEGGDKHRFGIFSNQDYEDEELLLYATWEALKKAKNPEVNYRLEVDLFDEKVSLGDTCQAIDRKFARPIEIQARVIAMEYDLMDIEGTMVVEMGQFLDLGDNRLDDLEREVEGIKNNPPSAIIDEDSYPNVKPRTPINLEAHGGIEIIQVYWEYDYDQFLYFKHYEVYGSRTEDFVPDTQHLLWRGDVSSFAHNVGTDEVWYYRVRAVNYHGTPSDWSDQVRGATQRVISDDILFGEDIAEELRELSKTSKLLADGTIDLSTIGDDVKSEINTAKNQAGEAVEKANLATSNANEAIEEAQGAFDEAQSAITKADSAFNMADALSTVVDKNTGDISSVTQIAQGLQTKVSDAEGNISILQQTANSFGTRIGNAESNISTLTQTAQGLQTTVKSVRDDLDGLEYENRNLIIRSTETENTFIDLEGGLVVSSYRSTSDYINVVPNSDYMFSKSDSEIDYNDSGFFRWAWYDENKNYISRAANSSNEFMWSVPDDAYFVRISYPKDCYPKYEKGNKATDWSPAPEDMATQSQITQLSDVISSKITKGQADGWYASQSQLTQTASSLQSTIKGVRDDLEGLEVGGANLAGLDDFYAWTASSYSRNEYVVTIDTGNADRGGVRIRSRIFEEGKNYVLSFKIKKLSGDIERIAGHCEGFDSESVFIDGEQIGTAWMTPNPFPNNDETHQIEVHLEYNGDTTNNDLYIQPNRSGYELPYACEIWDIQVEQGTKATAWNPSYKDLATQSQISQLSDNINLRVEKGDVVNQINVDTSGVLISGQKIRITGQTTIDDGVIKSATIADAAISSAKIAKLAVGTAAISDAAITRSKLEKAVIGTAQIEDGAITNAKIGRATIDTAKIADGAITNAKIADLSADKIKTGTLLGIDVISRLDNREVRMYNGQITLHQNNEQVGYIRPARLVNDNAVKGYEIVSSRDYLSLGFHTEGTVSSPIAQWRSDSRVGYVQGSDETSDSGRLFLKSTTKGGTADGAVPQIRLTNYTDSSGTPWSGILNYVGRDNRNPNNANFRSGFEVWQYKGDKSGAANQLFKIDSDSTGSFTSTYTDRTFLGKKAHVKAKNGSNYAILGASVTPRLQNIHGTLDANPVAYVDVWDNFTVGSNGTGSGTFTVNNAENVYAVFTQVEGDYSSNIISGVQNVTSTGFKVYLLNAGGRANANSRSYRVKIMIIYEPS
ncbi:phage tail spike protein [Oceanobacillus neutriphilus]|uniref:Uncharacterized protein n=1 Tax=Oceanobacillus neutriphilus TaxID=531815 RepID=A0ABQ2NYN5_9BACI|nr:phage tail spike protein [Oceanobacillus neutriphilus]GGP13580.1 hypothetical protein GCM10011346_34140 [Oceanobacillus neutriphilus]